MHQNGLKPCVVTKMVRLQDILKACGRWINGVEHYFVEVTSKEGIQYGLQAYGNEAVELYKQTMRTVGGYLIT
jgi:hypothetical protein